MPAASIFAMRSVAAMENSGISSSPIALVSVCHVPPSSTASRKLGGVTWCVNIDDGQRCSAFPLAGSPSSMAAVPRRMDSISSGVSTPMLLSRCTGSSTRIGAGQSVPSTTRSAPTTSTR